MKDLLKKLYDEWGIDEAKNNFVDGIKRIYDSIKNPKEADTPISAPTTNPLPTSQNRDTTSFDDTEKGKASLGAYNTLKGDLSAFKDFDFSQNGWLENVKKGIQNYGKFSYDINADALYQQMAERYAQQGKMAMEDTMGQAAAMTGGYGNSYAATVGNQAYQAHLDKLNDRLPELYQMALQRYQMGKEDLYNQYGMLMSEYEREYGLYSDEYNKLLDSLGIARDDYYSGADMFYTEQNNKNNAISSKFNEEMALWEAETGEAWNQAEWDEGIRRYERQYEDSKVPVGGSGGSDGSGNTGNSNNNNLNGGYKASYTENVEKFKSYVGTRKEFDIQEKQFLNRHNYKTYEAYLEGKLDEWLQTGKLNEDEVATLIAYYGLA